MLGRDRGLVTIVAESLKIRDECSEHLNLQNELKIETFVHKKINHFLGKRGKVLVDIVLKYLDLACS